jgi:large subunit ribosomal protein L20
MRVKTGIVRHANHKAILKKAKGYRGRRKSVFKLAKQAVIKAGQYSYRDRRVKKRTFRALWILRINAAVRAHDMSYSEFMGKLAKSKLELNRKMLADLAVNDPKALEEIVKKIK